MNMIFCFTERFSLSFNKNFTFSPVNIDMIFFLLNVFVSYNNLVILVLE